MKTSRRIHSSKNYPPGWILFWSVIACGFAAPAIGDVRTDKPVVMNQVVVEVPKTHTLFMGADISVNLDKELYPVQNVLGSSWVLVVNGRQKFISTKIPINLKITPRLKLTETSASITGFRRAATYSYANDPSVRLTRALTQAGSTNADLQAVAENAQHMADTASNKALGGAAVFVSADNQFGAAALLLTAQTSPAIVHSPKPNANGSVPPNLLVPSTLPDGQALVVYEANLNANAAASQASNANEPTGRVATTGLDAMAVEFEISSAKTLREPYVVTMTRFHTKGSKPGTVQDLVYAQALDPIDQRPTRVHFTEEGFPYDYDLVDFQLHIYDRGQEIPTDISSKRVQLTREEAFEYVKMDYVGSHRDETLPAVPAMGNLPSDMPARLASGKYDKAFFVKVSKDGLADTPFADASCSKRIDDPFLESVVKCLRFEPALANGNPVEGVAKLNLNELHI